MRNVSERIGFGDVCAYSERNVMERIKIGHTFVNLMGGAPRNVSERINIGHTFMNLMGGAPGSVSERIQIGHTCMILMGGTPGNVPESIRCVNILQKMLEGCFRTRQNVYKSNVKQRFA